MAIDVRLGKQRLWVGAPLRIRVRVDLHASDSKTVIFRYSNLDETDHQSNNLQLELDENREVVADISTRNLVPGAYEIAVSIPHQKDFVLATPVWVLSEDEFV